MVLAVVSLCNRPFPAVTTNNPTVLTLSCFTPLGLQALQPCSFSLYPSLESQPSISTLLSIRMADCRDDVIVISSDDSSDGSLTVAPAAKQIQLSTSAR